MDAGNNNGATSEFAAYLEHCIPKWKRDFESGDSKGLFTTISMSICAGIQPPPWAIEAFDDCVDRVCEAEVGSWDEAFGRPYPKGTHLAKLRRKLQLEFYSSVFKRISQIVAWRPGDEPIAAWLTERASIGPALFEAVGKEFGIGPRTCKDLYYEQKKRKLRDLTK